MNSLSFVNVGTAPLGTNARLALRLIMGLVLPALLLCAEALAATCPDPTGGAILPPGSGEDLEVIGPCTVNASEVPYHYGYVNIYRPADAPPEAPDAELKFEDGKIDFWARSILVENRGALLAGEPTKPLVGPLTIHLFGYDERDGIDCKLPRCGVRVKDWTKDPTDPIVLPAPTPEQVVKDLFYRYGFLDLDKEGKPDPRAGYFGYKVLAVSYGGTLRLFGERGGFYDHRKTDYPRRTSWARLAKDLNKQNCTAAAPCTVQLDRPVDWRKGDRIVVTTTDYLPGHSELFTVGAPPAGRTRVNIIGRVDYPHNGTAFSLTRIPERLALDDSDQKAETRAAVALLDRSIGIVSGGEKFRDPLLPATSPDPHRYFGGHTVVRQGVKEFLVQGVEFYQLGQGGRIGHYPVHFHMLRKAPTEAVSVTDSAVHDSMTRWYTVHATQGITLARNVGYKSIGHGYYLEDGTEINNRLWSNLGIFARAAVDNDQNDRKVPGILDFAKKEKNADGKETFSSIRFHSDSHHPTLFWIMNGWNDFRNNVAVGAGACGACYWLTAGANSGPSRDQKWSAYASMQDSNQISNLDRVGTTPLHVFRGNSCSTAMLSFTGQMEMGECKGVGLTDPDSLIQILHPIPNEWAPPPDPAYVSDKAVITERYYPLVKGIRHATRCDGEGEQDCSKVPVCSGAAATNNPNCMVTVLDRYTTSFNWAETNFSAIWLRPQWGLVTNSVITDAQNAGLTFVSGGDYTYSSNPPGNWNLARKTVFVGNTQTSNRASPDYNAYASNAGPFNETGGLKCERQNNGAIRGDFCLSKAEGVSLQLAGFAVNQRLFNVYDGPAYEDANAFLDIGVTDLTKCGRDPNAGTNHICNAPDAEAVQGYVVGVPFGNPDNDAQKGQRCYLPNAAIGWKQPNGFYYPPTFHSADLFFSEVDIRHFVIAPLFRTIDVANPFPFKTDQEGVQQSYCTRLENMWNGFTDVDRQTELTDDDGSLTGFVNTISVNNDPFFTAPVETSECKSGTTYDTFQKDPTKPIADFSAKTSPYDYVTTVIYPDCAAGKSGGDALISCEGESRKPPPENPPPAPTRWSQTCTNEKCYGVPLYRRLTTEPERDAGARPMMRMMGQSTFQRSNLTVNHGDYYIDTTVPREKQLRVGDPTCAPWCDINVFEKNNTYYVFLLYATPATRQTYRLYVGKNFKADTGLKMVRANIENMPLKFDEGLWPSGWRSSLSEKGVLTVTMNFKDDAGFAGEFEAAKQKNCAPSTFCAWDRDAKRCGVSPVLEQDNPLLYRELKDDQDNQDHPICTLTQKDVDCPEGGCYGFAVTLADDFETGEGPKPPPSPAPNCIDSSDPFYRFWNVDFQRADPALAGDCSDATAGVKTFCDPKLPGRRTVVDSPLFGPGGTH